MDLRNPIEAFRDKYMSFGPVKAYKLFAIRLGMIPYDPGKVDAYARGVRQVWDGHYLADGEMGKFIGAYRDMGVKRGRQPWITKYFNARFSLHVGYSYPVGKRWLILPFVGLQVRLSKLRYFQFGGIFGPEGAHVDGTDVWERSTICGKLRIAEFKNEYTKGGNYDVLGEYEGLT